MIDGRTEDNNTKLRQRKVLKPSQFISYQVSKKSAKALPRYGSGHKNAYSKKHFFKIQRAISLFLTDGVQMPFGVHHPLMHIYTHTKFQ
jgi:hypothetical protein